MLLLWMLLVAPASAGGGPWTLQPREHNVYVGLDYFRYSAFRGRDASEPRTLASGLTAAGVTGVWTLGLASDVEAELKVPFESVRVNDPRTPDCRSDDKPEDWCTTTAGLGDVAGAVKWRIIDELYRSPVSVSLSGAFRSGEAYAGKRGRLTTLGDGQTDVGVGMAVGRTSGVGQGWYTASAEVWYFARFSNGRDAAGAPTPSDEVAFGAEGMWAFHPRVAVGPAFFGFTRTGGADFEDLDFQDINGLTSLHGTQLKAGAKAAFFSVEGGPTLVVTAAWTFYARNNPSDTLSVGFGMGWFLPRERTLKGG